MLWIVWVSLVGKCMFMRACESAVQDLWIARSAFWVLDKHDLKQIQGLGLPAPSDDFRIRIKLRPKVMLGDSVNIWQKAGGIYLTYGTSNVQINRFGWVVPRLDK